MRSSQRNIHTRYHAMEAAGLFDDNPANPTARDIDGMSLYKGPVEFPRMLYHPKGEERITVPGEYILSPGGRESLVGQQRELISHVVRNREEEAEALAEGWHRTPAQSIAAANDPKRPAPAESPAQVIADKDAEIAELKRKFAEATSPSPGGRKASASASQDLSL